MREALWEDFTTSDFEVLSLLDTDLPETSTSVEFNVLDSATAAVLDMLAVLDTAVSVIKLDVLETVTSLLGVFDLVAPLEGGVGALSIRDLIT